MKRLLWLCGLLLCCLSLLTGQPRAEAYGMTAEDIYPQVVYGEELEGRARQTLSLMLLEAEEGRRYTLEAVHVPRELRLPEGDYELEVTVPNGLRYWGNTAVKLQAVVDGKPFRAIVCHFKIHLFDQVAVATRLLMPGQPVGDGDFRFEEREVGASPQKFVTRREDVVGMVLGRPVQPGQVIQRFMLHRPVLVESGSQVTIVSNSHGVSVKMDGIALDNGREGTVIRVRNVSTHRIVKAKVLDAHTVEAVF